MKFDQYPDAKRLGVASENYFAPQAKGVFNFLL
jgi:hypothetical protein